MASDAPPPRLMPLIGSGSQQDLASSNTPDSIGDVSLAVEEDKFSRMVAACRTIIEVGMVENTNSDVTRHE